MLPKPLELKKECRAKIEAEKESVDKKILKKLNQGIIGKGSLIGMITKDDHAMQKVLAKAFILHQLLEKGVCDPDELTNMLLWIHVSEGTVCSDDITPFAMVDAYMEVRLKLKKFAS